MRVQKDSLFGVYVDRETHRSGDTSLKVSLFSGFTCDRSDAVRTNCPTQLEKLGRSLEMPKYKSYVVLTQPKMR